MNNDKLLKLLASLKLDNYSGYTLTIWSIINFVLMLTLYFIEFQGKYSLRRAYPIYIEMLVFLFLIFGPIYLFSKRSAVNFFASFEDNVSGNINCSKGVGATVIAFLGASLSSFISIYAMWKILK